MSKELPYFRFTAFEWLNDDISLEDFETKGVFIDVCAYYWFKDCSITRAMLEKRFSNAIPVIELLFKSEIIKFRNGDDFIEISFLNKQFDELSGLRKQRQDAGSKGGKQKASKAKAKLKQNPSYKDKDKDKDKDKIIGKNGIDFQFVVDNYHSLCPDMNKVQVINNVRKGFINGRVGEYGMEKVIMVLRMAGESDFLNGKISKFRADFEWIMRPTNFLKIMEGKYTNKTELARTNLQMP